MMKNGEIEAEDRKNTALAPVQSYDNVDGVELTDTDVKAADTMIEAGCDKMGHTVDTIDKTE